MPSRIRILPYKKGSKSARALSNSLGGKLLKLEGSKWKARDGDLIINWGSRKEDHPVFHQDYGCILNFPEDVARASDKIKAFRAMEAEDVSIPSFTTDSEEAEEWAEDGELVVCRTVLNGHSGEGIVLAGEGYEDLVDAPLYTKYIKKKDEYRIHVVNGKVIFVQRKARKLEVPDDEVNWKIRNLHGGFIYAHEDVKVDWPFEEEAIKAVDALGLMFGAVDIISNKGNPYVLEVNTACGLEGTTLERYSEAFRELI